MDLAGRVVVVTGSGAGIGAAISEVCCEYGAKVIGLDCNLEMLNQTVKRITDKGGMIESLCADVASEQSVERAFDEISFRHEKIDVLVNNVGVEFYKDFVDVGVSDWERQISVNLKSVFLCCCRWFPK